MSRLMARRARIAAAVVRRSGQPAPSAGSGKCVVAVLQGGRDTQAAFHHHGCVP
jgi:hypothetical protein